MSGLKDRTVILVGGSGGLGSAVARRIAAAGGSAVIGCRRNRERAESLGQEIGAPVVVGDVVEEETRRRLVETASVTGAPYGLVVLAGNPARFPIEDATTEQFLESYRDNLVGPILMARDFAKVAAPDASVVLVSTMQATAVFSGSVAYAAPKAALVHSARILAKQWGGSRGIRVNVVAPGVTDSGMAQSSVQSGKYDGFVKEGVITRFGRPDDVARVVLTLLEPDNYVTGQVITIDGGLTLRM